MAQGFGESQPEETQTVSEPVNRPDRSINPNRQHERERPRGAEDDEHFGDGQTGRPDQGGPRKDR